MWKCNFSAFYYNVVIGAISLAFIVVFVIGCSQMVGSLDGLNQNISLELRFLPEYLLRTGMRFFFAIFFSLVFSIIYATIAAKNKRIGRFLIYILDILQSIPVIGYLSLTVTLFLNLAPNNILGVELAIIFAIFTSQVWNMIFSIYQSLISVPTDLYEVARIYKLNNWKIFWKIELPFAIPNLIWNVILSMSSGWFFIVVSEVIIVGLHSYTVPGMGAYIALALKTMNVKAIIYATMAILTIICIFNELFLKPFATWSYKFLYEFNIGANKKNYSWLLDCMQRAEICNIIVYPIRIFCHFIINIKLPKIISKYSYHISIIFEIIWWLLIVLILFVSYQQLYFICINHLKMNDIMISLEYCSITALRVIILLLISSIIWIPIGIFIGLRPRLISKVQPIIQFLTALPASLYYPVFVITILHFNLNPNIWLSIMMVVGSQWYILYNVIGGTQAIPNELLEVGAIIKLNWLHKTMKIIFPAIFPAYVTGLITAAGASWNASIIAEIISWGDTTLITPGIGSYITTNTTQGNFPQIALGLMVMILFVLILDNLIWQPLYKFASTKFCLE